MMQTATLQLYYYPECTVVQAGATAGISRFRCGQGAPDRPSSQLLYKDKESAKPSRFTAPQLTVLAVQARIQHWLVLGLPGVRRGCTTTAPSPLTSLVRLHYTL